MRQDDLLDDLVRHAAWADATIWETVLDGVADESGLDSQLELWLHHIHVVQRAFLYLWRGEPLELLPEAGDFTDPRALADWGREGHVEIRRFLAEADDVELDRELDVPWTAQLKERWNRPIRPVSVAESAAQVAMHSTHHRGQVATRLRQVGAEPPMVDFIAWIWFGKPEPEWPGAAN